MLISTCSSVRGQNTQKEMTDLCLIALYGGKIVTLCFYKGKTAVEKDPDLQAVPAACTTNHAPHCHIVFMWLQQT